MLENEIVDVMPENAKPNRRLFLVIEDFDAPLAEDRFSTRRMEKGWMLEVCEQGEGDFVLFDFGDVPKLTYRIPRRVLINSTRHRHGQDASALQI